MFSKNTNLEEVILLLEKQHPVIKPILRGWHYTTNPGRVTLLVNNTLQHSARNQFIVKPLMTLSKKTPSYYE
jgi:hypothetical protein